MLAVVHVGLCKQTHTCARACACLCVHVHVRVHAYARVHVHMHVHKHSFVQARQMQFTNCGKQGCTLLRFTYRITSTAQSWTNRAYVPSNALVVKPCCSPSAIQGSFSSSVTAAKKDSKRAASDKQTL